MTTPKAKPWQRRSLRPHVDNVVVRGTPRAQISVYDDVVLLTRRDTGGRWCQYPIDPHTLATTLARVPHASGLLPPGTLAAGRAQGLPFTIQYVAPQRRTLHLSDGRTWSVPLPPLVIGGCGQQARVFALAARAYPRDDHDVLHVAPFPNCYEDGCICWGDVELPRGAGVVASPAETLDLFLDSHFNLHLADGKSKTKPQSVVALWDTLVEERRYPLDDLVPTRLTLSWLCSGGPWGGAL